MTTQHIFALLLIGILIVLQCLDYYTTHTILANGGRELNPVMRWLMEHMSIDDALLFKGFVVVAVAVILFLDNLYALAAMDIVFALVVMFNWRSMP